jgi:nitronate monooxygenase
MLQTRFCERFGVAAPIMVAPMGLGSVEAAVRARQAGVDMIIAQGVEAGGHVAGEVSTIVLLPRIVDAVAPTLVLAAGGIANARGLAAALCLGADGVVMGTRYLATPEANAHPVYKARIQSSRGCNRCAQTCISFAAMRCATTS